MKKEGKLLQKKKKKATKRKEEKERKKRRRRRRKEKEEELIVCKSERKLGERLEKAVSGFHFFPSSLSFFWLN